MTHQNYHSHRTNVATVSLLIILWSVIVVTANNNNVISCYSSRSNVPGSFTLKRRSRASILECSSSVKAKSVALMHRDPNFEIMLQDRIRTPDGSSSLYSDLGMCIIRGGGMNTFFNQHFLSYAGASAFILLDILFRRLFTANDIYFPSQLGACCIFFMVLLLLDGVIGVGDYVYLVLMPGATLLTKWLPVFFVPGLVMLPFAPNIGNGIEVLKVATVIVLGFFFSLCTTAFSVLSLRKFQGSVSVLPPPSSESHPASSSLQQQFSMELLDRLVKAYIITGCASIGATRTNNMFAIPMRTIFMGFTTLTGFVFGARLPFKITQFIHPIITTTVFVLFTSLFTSVWTGESFLSNLSTYKLSSTLSPFTAGAGDYFMHLLNPAVISFSIAMYGRRKIAAKNIMPILLSMIVASAGGLFGTAWLVRLFNFSKHVVCLSVLPRNVTTPLAIAIASMLQADISLTTSIVIISGIFGGTIGTRILNKLNISDPVSRGLSIGASAQSVGVVSVSVEKESFPFAAISMILTAICATTLVSIPVVREMLVNIATG